MHTINKHTSLARIITLSLATLLGACVLLNAAACTDVALRCESSQCQPLAYAPPLDNRLDFAGSACTASPNTVGYPYKVLFIVDVSGSTSDSDPTNNRGPAVQAVLQQYASNPEISFAIISFDTQPNLLETTFTRDMNVLLPVVPQLNAHRGFTNYLDTLKAAQAIIAADANSLDLTQRARTRYDIQWLSDGVPVPCVSVAEVLGAEQALLDLTTTYGLFDIKLSTVFLTGASGDGGCDGGPDQIMQPMAHEGRGSYQALTGPNLHFNIDFSTILQPFSKQLFYVVNESRTVKNGRLYADSDRDGVSDVDETARGTNPTEPDSHGFGCSDGVAFAQAVNPNLCDNICAVAAQKNNNVLPDTDGDGLKDCEELAMSTTRFKADTDGDNFIDSLELRFGTNAGDSATITTDTDVDGVTDGAEILTGTDPLTAESDRSLAYVYAPLKQSTDANTPDGETCFSFTVQNVQMVPTVATPQNKEGDNVICAYVEQRPTGTASGDTEVTVSRACVTANYRIDSSGNAIKTPADGTVTFKASDFEPYICGSVPCP